MWLIIGYGNPLRGDDGLGPLIAERLSSHLPSHQAKIITTHQLTPELALELAAPEIQSVLFIDAIRDQPSPTNLVKLTAKTVESCGHQMSPSLLLQLSATLYQKQPPGWLLTVSGVAFDFSQQLSEHANRSANHALQTTLEFIQPKGGATKTRLKQKTGSLDRNPVSS